MNPLTFVLVLARLIAGEAGVCDIDAKIAVAHVNANRIEAGIVGGWYGDADPSYDDMAAAMYWQAVPDPTDGALYLFSAADEGRDAVQAITADATMTAQFPCAGGMLRAWRP